MAPMNPRLLRPLTGGVHPDANAWRSAVVANGGSVSATTMRAVGDFCRAIDAAGIRDRFYRLNLFAGTGLPACLVPLYRGPSRSSTQYGNTIDNNDGPFVAEDYTETGTSGGLTTGANNSTKTLDTGLVPFNAGITHDNSHMAYYSRQGNTSTGSVMATSITVSSTEQYQFFINGISGSVGMIYRSGGSNNSGFESQPAERTGHVIAQRSSAGGALYRNGSNLNATSVTTTATVWTTDRPLAARVFGRRTFNGSTLVDGTDQRISTTLQCYSLGLSFSDAQAAAYYTALQAFQTALGRQL
jgi:hypothetical protein